jgi:nickel/cobalt transporter (NicO) family protein
MKRALVAFLALAAIAVPATASAHPLGNFSINHLVRVRVDASQVRLHYILDQAEIPTFQERGVPGPVVLARKRAEVLRRLALTVDGRPTRLRTLPGARLTHPPGQGGLPLTRVELDVIARVHDPRSVAVHDATFPGRVGWKAIVAAPGRGTAVRSSVPATDPTGGLRAYPQALLSSPLDQRSASFAVRPGDGTLTAPHGAAAAHATHNRSGDGLAGVFERGLAGRGVLLVLLLAAFGWGALHALSPGHGKTMVAAYLVGTRGTARHALALGATVTIAHTLGVFALGVVTLTLSQYVLPEQLYPWLNLVSGLLVVGIGLTVLRSRIRHLRRRRHHHHHHHHDVPDRITWRGLIAMGASAGIIPCPSALVVLLGAIAQHHIALGLLLITAFSLGLAATLSGLGLLVVHAKRLAGRIDTSGRLVATLPAVSTLAILGLGVALTARAVPHLT